MNSDYELLGLQNNASYEEIKKKYHNLSLKHHPDRPNGNKELFQKMKDAYDRISSSKEKTYHIVKIPLNTFITGGIIIFNILHISNCDCFSEYTKTYHDKCKGTGKIREEKQIQIELKPLSRQHETDCYKFFFEIIHPKEEISIALNIKYALHGGNIFLEMINTTLCIPKMNDLYSYIYCLKYPNIRIKPIWKINDYCFKEEEINKGERCYEIG